MCSKQNLNLSELAIRKNIWFYEYPSKDLYLIDANYNEYIKNFIENKNELDELKSLLIICPDFKGLVEHRKKIKNIIDKSNQLVLIESIDHKSFYNIAKNTDKLCNGVSQSNPYIIIKNDILKELFNKTALGNWFNEKGIKNKINIKDKAVSSQIKELIDVFFKKPQCKNMLSIVKFFKENLRFKCGRPEFYYAFIKSLNNASMECSTVYEAMKEHRNIIRRTGRRIEGKCIANTLLTKGLEFDTVVILDAHLFKCPKHLYVALTRCRKKLIIFSENETLSPYLVKMKKNNKQIVIE